jgi:glucose/arabinose dehydrogenase
VFPQLRFSAPVAMLQAPNDGTRWFVLEQAGLVRVFANDPRAAASATFIDIEARVDSGGELGLLGMAFHPAFPADPRFYLSYTNADAGRVSRISEFRLGADGRPDPGTERILLRIHQPERNHNGGQIAFGPDGYLYIGMGDGGGANDRHGAIGNAQLMTTLLGKMLRIDVAAPRGYGVPPDNPFAGNAQCGATGSGAAPCPEIYASGLRNPWRWSFDRRSGELWVGDVGQNALEEIDRVRLGGNYGWRCFEGSRATRLACGSEADLQPPVAEYGRGEGSSVTGGYVYRGTRIAGLQGRYVFGDFVSGRLWHIAGDARPTLRVTGGVPSGLNISSFGEGNDGELYVVHYGGELYRLRGP